MLSIEFMIKEERKIIFYSVINSMRKINYLLTAALAAVLVSCGGNQGKPGFGDNEYAVRTIQGQSASLQTTYPAVIKGVQDVEIRPKISGFITKMCVKEGQTVKAGQLLFVIDNVTYAAAVRQAKAAVNSAKAQLNTSKLTYENSQKLFQSNVIGDYELQSAKNSYESAEAALAQAQANYVSAKQNLDFCYIKSPSAGVVGNLPYRVGALVSSSSQEPLTTISNIKTMQVYFSMTEKDLLDMTRTSGGLHAAISDYPAVKLQLADGTMYAHPGRVAAVSGVIDSSTGSVSIRAESIVVPHESTNAVIIPQDAVSEVQDRNFVYVVGKDNKVKYTEVSLNAQNDGKNYIITKGLNIGDRIVVSGISTLTDGMQIKPLTEAQYAEKLKKTTELGASQGDLGELKKALSK